MVISRFIDQRTRQKIHFLAGPDDVANSLAQKIDRETVLPTLYGGRAVDGEAIPVPNIPGERNFLVLPEVSAAENNVGQEPANALRDDDVADVEGAGAEAEQFDSADEGL